MNRAAQSLGKLSRGVPRRFTPEQIKRLKDRLAKARKKRWVKK